MPKIVPVHYRRLVCILEHDLFLLSRSHGDHLVYTKMGVKRPIIIPAYKDVPVFVIKNLLHTANMTRERYFELLDRCS